MFSDRVHGHTDTYNISMLWNYTETGQGNMHKQQLIFRDRGRARSTTGFLSENEAPFQDVIYDIDDVDDMFHIISRCPTFLDLFGGLLHVQYSSVWPHVST